MKNLRENTKRLAAAAAAVLLAAAVLAGCASPVQSGSSQPQTPADEAAISLAVPETELLLDLELVEGENQVLFVQDEQREQYIPQTGWRQAERSAPEETCALTVVSVGGEADQAAAEAFFSGQSQELILQPGQSVLVELNGAHWLSEIQVAAEDEVRLSARCSNNGGLNTYWSAELDQAGGYTLESPVLCTYLQLRCPEDGQTVRLKQLVVRGVPSLYEQVLREIPEDSVVMESTDENNPVSVYRIPLLSSFYELADRLLDGQDELTEHQKIMVFMDYISDFRVGSDSRHPSSELGLHVYIAACGGYSNVLAALAATQGIPARLLTLGNYPENTGHAVCEVYYEDGWHLYDPTYGAYYTTTPENTETPAVLGYEELSAGAGDDSAVTCVVTSLARLRSGMDYGFLGPAIYEKADPKGILGSGEPMHYPLSLDWQPGGATVDESQFDTSRQGIQFLGATSICYMQDWTLRGLTPGQAYQFTVTASYVLGEAGGDFVAGVEAENASVTQNEEHIFNNDDPASMEWVIEFTAQSDAVELDLTHDYRGPEYHYILPIQFELQQAE